MEKLVLLRATCFKEKWKHEESNSLYGRLNSMPDTLRDVVLYLGIVCMLSRINLKGKALQLLLLLYFRKQFSLETVLLLLEELHLTRLCTDVNRQSYHHCLLTKVTWNRKVYLMIGLRLGLGKLHSRQWLKQRLRHALIELWGRKPHYQEMYNLN